MATKINHVIFGGSSSSSAPWAPRALAAVGALALLVAIIFFWPGNVADRYQAAYDAGRFDEALEIARGEAIDNPDAAAPLVAAAAALIQKAYLNQDREASAISAADFAGEAVTLDPSSVDGWRALGAAKQILGDAKGAAESYARAAALAPNDPALLVQIGGAIALSDPEEATRYYERALSADPANPLAGLALARAALAVGNYGRAEGNLASALAEGVPTALAAEARVTLSDLELARGNGAEAEAAAREAIALAPGNAAAKIALAQALYDGIFERHLTPDTTLVEVRTLAAEAQALRPSSALASFVSFSAAYAAGDKIAANEAAARTRALIPNDQTLSAADREELSARVDLLQNMEMTVTQTSR